MNERLTFLRNLSSDHHQGLVLARKARKAETASAEARENVSLRRGRCEVSQGKGARHLELKDRV